ncbi:hypothetical protein H113_06952 [Trichophyton rubrum MR1459]|uniref:Uncharacterized protein n=1 Tax=Trichophyton rubrum (strain ATCC MYA-4607 / CBS 118892) TaxID=559305 RepID=A0A080WJH5_TRIRC|nr:uncharacterized protein TERG_11822 [Trichophyton rubrum CBS 118892]EZF92163.1 hypothetical protein H113_06952 [Trichophyton rubrum MR1459]KFL60822.1 hypothetical protein TERG_11822 [Trichophyton rubrum CBS 118892]
MQGRAASALSKRSRTLFSLAPIYLLRISGPFTLIKLRPHSPATALARSVLPHPGNPYSKSPERSRSGHWEKIGAYFVGYCRVSSRVFLVLCKPPIAEKVVEEDVRVTFLRDAGVNPFNARSKSPVPRVITLEEDVVS